MNVTLSRPLLSTDQFFVRLHPTVHVKQEHGGLRLTSAVFAGDSIDTIWTVECIVSSVDCARLLSPDPEKALELERAIRDHAHPAFGIAAFTFAGLTAQVREWQADMAGAHPRQAAE